MGWKKCSEMASDTDRQVNSSPAKRLKLDHTDLLSDSSVEISIGSVPAPGKPSQDGFDPGMDPPERVLDGGDPRFRPRSSLSPSRPREPDGPQPSTFDISVCGIDIVSAASAVAEDVQQEVDVQEQDDDDDRDEVSSTVSSLSISGLSDMSGQGWKPVVGPMSWVQRQMLTGVKPREILNHFGADPTDIPLDMDDMTLWKIIVNMMTVPPRRPKLRDVNTLQDVVGLIKNCSRIIVLTGAGVSVSCGIPDFRSRDGIYSRLAVDFPDLPDPQAMFDINYFSQDPRPFFKFAREIYPGQFKPSLCHRFIKKIEDHGKLLRNYSQNIDTLEHVAGIKNVIECHGSFSNASCTRCKHKVTAEEIREDIMQQKIPLCPKCFHSGMSESCSAQGSTTDYSSLFNKGIMKPDIVFFGEGLPEAFHDAMAADKDNCDLLIVIGSSLKVRPVALIPNSIPAHVPQILINREPLPHLRFDIELLGDGDVIINQLCHLLDDSWSDLCSQPKLLEAGHLLPSSIEKKRVQYGSERRKSLDENKSVKSLESDIGTSLSSDEDVNRVLKEVIPEAGVNPVVVLSNEEVLSALDDHVMATEKSEFDGDVKLRHMSVDSTPDSDVEAGSSCYIKEADAELESRIAACVANSNVPVPSIPASAKERHMSLDSTRDSGIGDSCNSVDSSVDKDRDINAESTSDTTSCSWNKAKESLASRLPVNCFHFVTPSRYIFPGAEVFVERSHFNDSSSESGSDSHESTDESFEDQEMEIDLDSEKEPQHSESNSSLNAEESVDKSQQDECNTLSSPVNLCDSTVH
ncbi:NAD-dependent protein deacetylase sirtuin-1 [Frankliniella occidentalis]|uniref:protein acetyllysine N-acetyltransferase n=1 Tax=Frankliniella occidentalis TaxID=133901 RepID=A0A6J1T1Y8_FRAOC|nr:NAD-dependent protein deacetylase sirtuin-1 [Frankliniella occidentalis]